MQSSPKKAETDGARVTDSGGDGGDGKRRRRKTGRPQLAAEERLIDAFRIRATAAERAAAEAKAARAGLSVSEFARRALAGATITERASGRSVIPPALLSDLNRVGNNLNQIAHAAHLGRSLPAMAEQTLAEVRGLVALIVSRIERDES